MLKNWKKPLYLLSVFALICLTIVLSYWYFDEDRRFERFCNQVFKHEISSNTLSLHYTLAWPEDYGVKEALSPLPLYDRDRFLQNATLLDTYIEKLQNISSAKLSESNQFTYDLLLTYFEKLRRLEEYPYYESPFSPVNGVHSQLPILLSEYSFRCKEDVEDYLDILSNTDMYMDSLLQYQKDKTDAGLGLDDHSLTRASAQCLQLVSEKELAEGTHFLQSSFIEKVGALYSQGQISKKEVADYVLQNQELLVDTLLPAYQNVSQGLLSLTAGDNSLPKGLATYPRGKAYYSALVQFQTGSACNIAEMKNSLEQLLSTYRILLSKLITASPDSLLLLQDKEDEDWFPKETAVTMLSHLTKHMEKDFPSFPGNSYPSLTVKEVSSALKETSAPAFYLTPPIDESMSNVIYLNSSICNDTLSLYTTLAHEGYPGHLYQTVYYHLYCEENQVPNIRHILNYEGYQEGWALYVEFLSYDYLESLATEKGQPEHVKVYEIEKHNRMMQLCLYSLLDIYIHYDGYSQSQITAYLAAMGISDTATAEAIYRYIACAPGNYLKYFWSYVEILSLQKKTMYLMKDAYSDLAFHQFFLECGPSDFESLSKALALKNSLKLPSAF